MQHGKKEKIGKLIIGFSFYLDKEQNMEKKKKKKCSILRMLLGASYMCFQSRKCLSFVVFNVASVWKNV